MPSMASILPAPVPGALRPRDDELVVAFPSWLAPVDVEAEEEEDVADAEALPPPDAVVAAVVLLELELRSFAAHSPSSAPSGQQTAWVVLPV